MDKSSKVKNKTNSGRKQKKVVKKKSSPSKAFTKFIKNPIIMPKKENSWEAWQTFNPGVILLENKIHFLYRAIGEDGISRLGYAASRDGFHIDERFSYPVFEHQIQNPSFNIFSYFSGGSFGGVEDPRIIRVNKEETLYMTYTACDKGLCVALTSIKLKDFLNKNWQWKSPKLISKPNEVHKNWVIFPEKIDGKYAILHSINPQIIITYRDSLEFKENEYIESYYSNTCRKNCWDTYVRGAGPPPVKTSAGWLLFYHAIDESDPGKYKVGVMLLDLYNPIKILHRSKEPILEPEETYENNGFKWGVVYVCGTVIKDTELLVYYGASDSFVGIAHANIDEFVGALIKEAKPKLKIRTLKKK